MITISLCMIVKNEESVLARCLDSVKDIVDEIVIVDTGSEDKTVEIAGRYTDRIFHFPWINDFAAARNFSFSKAEKEYILWLDADDYIDEENRARFLSLKAEFPVEADVGMFRYHMTPSADGKVPLTYYRERLLRRSRGYQWNEPVHEHIVLHGNIHQFDIAVTHGEKKRSSDSATRNLNIYRNLAASGKPLSTRGMYYFARELMTHGYTDEAIDYYARFLGRDNAWIEDRLTARDDLAGLYMQKQDRKSAVRILIGGFEEALPRAKACCLLGRVYFEDGDLSKSVFWYETALRAPRADGWGFVYEEYQAFIPNMQLCMLYGRLGEMEKSREHHMAARKLRPKDPSVLYNEAYFEKHPVHTDRC